MVQKKKQRHLRQISLLLLRRTPTKIGAGHFPKRCEGCSPGQDLEVHLQWHSVSLQASVKANSRSCQEPSGVKVAKLFVSSLITWRKKVIVRLWKSNVTVPHSKGVPQCL